MSQNNSNGKQGEDVSGPYRSEAAPSGNSAAIGDGLTSQLETSQQQPRDRADSSVAADLSDFQEETISGKPYPARPEFFKFVRMPKTHANHTYRNFSNMPNDQLYTFPTRISDMNFHEKLYHLLCLSVVERGHATIAWCHKGRAFYVPDVEKLTNSQLLQRYFEYNNIQRFRKQLCNYGYKSIIRDQDLFGADCYYSEVCYAPFERCILLVVVYQISLEKLDLFDTSFCSKVCPTYYNTAHLARNAAVSCRIPVTSPILPIFPISFPYQETAGLFIRKLELFSLREVLLSMMLCLKQPFVQVIHSRHGSNNFSAVRTHKRWCTLQRSLREREKERAMTDLQYPAPDSASHAAQVRQRPLDTTFL